MLSEARKNQSIQFVRANASVLPFDDDCFDFVNISMGFHWVDQEKFLNEVRRVLKPNGFLNVDNYGFLGKISENIEKQKLYSELFETYLPSASRKSGYPTKELIDKIGFRVAEKFSYNHKVNLNSDEFTNLIMTWSNFQIQNKEQQKVTEQKMLEVFEQVFESEALLLEFGGTSVLYKVQNG